MAKSVTEFPREEQVRAVLTGDELLLMQHAIHDVYIADEVYRYLVRLVDATRNHAYLLRGASPRATIALVKMAKAAAYLSGRNYVTPADIAEQFPYVAAHRIFLNPAARADHVEKGQIIDEILHRIRRPQLGVKK